ncbi:hypothetical protein ACI8AC_04970 [Geodermatophilus sp. SYSU D00758]
MTTVRTVRRPPAGQRRAGYLVGALVNGVLLWLLHVWPGWEAVPFLTDATPQALGLVDATLVAGIVVAAVELVWDPRRLVALGELVTTALGLAATVRVLQVFPFDLAGAWPAVVRVVLWIGVVGAAIGVLVALVRLVRPAAR